MKVNHMQSAAFLVLLASFCVIYLPVFYTEWSEVQSLKNAISLARNILIMIGGGCLSLLGVLIAVVSILYAIPKSLETNEILGIFKPDIIKIAAKTSELIVMAILFYMITYLHFSDLTVMRNFLIISIIYSTLMFGFIANFIILLTRLYNIIEVFVALNMDGTEFDKSDENVQDRKKQKGKHKKS